MPTTVSIDSAIRHARNWLSGRFVDQLKLPIEQSRSAVRQSGQARRLTPTPQPIMTRPLDRPRPRTGEGDVAALDDDLALPGGERDAL